MAAGLNVATPRLTALQGRHIDDRVEEEKDHVLAVIHRD
jgi:hypothetical protein